ncbi:MAG: hypothetical protein IT165_06520 [Bryobacterales bacterium]|nr:hypothetical protein [Bryobacterales bacterium]
MTKQQAESQPQILMEEVNDTFRIFHTNFALTSTAGYQLCRNELPEGGESCPLADDILSIEGTEVCVVKCYGCGVHRAPLFPWEPITAEVERILLWVASAFAPGVVAQQSTSSARVTPPETHPSAVDASVQ